MALPSTRFNFKGGKKEVAEAVGEIGKAIFSQVTMSVEGAVKTVVPSVSDMVADITAVSYTHLTLPTICSV